jgi:recombinational DNA repair protein (RecF pathway)
MREIKEERFKKIEDVGFNPKPLPEPPQKKVGVQTGPAVADQQTFERTDPQSKMEAPSSTAYIIQIPKMRRKTRQSFDIFEDQYDALKKIQLAEAEMLHSKTPQKLGDMTQEALTHYIEEKARKLKNIKIVKESNAGAV